MMGHPTICGKPGGWQFMIEVIQGSQGIGRITGNTSPCLVLLANIATDAVRLFSAGPLL